MYKRLFDVIVSGLGLVILSPIFFGIVFIIKINDRGPVFFRQKRIGKDKKPFRLLKFRTMSVCRKAGTFEPGSKSRVTPVGRVLRKTKLDELPQLINVFRGDLTFVGPRPEVRKWTKIYPEKWDIVHTVKPGITDTASIIYRNEEEILASSSDPELMYKQVILPHKLDLNIKYIRKNSLGGDISILLKTLSEVMFK